MAPVIRTAIRVEGIVQGVGFRPFVYSLAVVAVKGLGGYHLAASATCEDAVAALRARKHREDKPFALLAADLGAASRLCEVSDAAASLLTSRARPIVLLPRLPSAAVAAATAPANRQLIRRSRGYVPEPVTVRGGFPRPVLACGAELKNTFCLAKERHAFVSNMLLLQRAVTRLEASGFSVLLHSRVPCNDGGISLGQAVVAAARDMAGQSR